MNGNTKDGNVSSCKLNRIETWLDLNDCNWRSVTLSVR